MDPIFATLTPVNVLAKMAFSDVFNSVTCGQQGALTDAAVRRMTLLLSGDSLTVSPLSSDTFSALVATHLSWSPRDPKRYEDAS